MQRHCDRRFSVASHTSQGNQEGSEIVSGICELSADRFADDPTEKSSPCQIAAVRQSRQFPTRDVAIYPPQLPSGIKGIIEELIQEKFQRTETGATPIRMTVRKMLRHFKMPCRVQPGTWLVPML